MLAWRNLRTKLLIVFLGLLLIPIMGIGFYGYVFISQTVLSKAIEVEKQNLDSQASHVRSILVETQNALIYLSELNALRVLENSAPDTDLYQSSLSILQSDLQSFVRTHPITRQLAYFNALGEPTIGIWADGDDVFLNNEAFDYLDDFVQQVLSAPVGTTHLMLAERDDGTPHDLILALRSNDGVLLKSIASEWLFQPGINNVISETWSLHLPIQAVLNVRGTGETMLSPELNAHDDWQRNSRGVYRSDDNYVFFQNVSVPTLQGQYNVVLFHTIPERRLQADLNQYAQAFVTLTVGVLFCVIALGSFAIDRFVEPIRYLKQSMDDIRKTGKTPMLPRELPPDEIGELSLAFYTMAIELEVKRKSERALVEKLINAQEEERKRIAYDLHDGLLQQLVGARFHLNQCKTLSLENLSERSVDLFTLGYETLSEAIVEGRRIMQGLHPNILDDLGIVEALRDLCNNMAQAGNWHLELDLDQLEQEPNRIVSVTLYRVTQEALNNACKHAGANTVRVQLRAEDDLHLMIMDDGHGFDLGQLSTNGRGWGLRTMKERVSLLDGDIQIDSKVNMGTIITVNLPNKKEVVEEVME